MMTMIFDFSSKCPSAERSFHDAREYHGEVDLGTPAEKPPQWSTAWLQGTICISFFHVDCVLSEILFFVSFSVLPLLQNMQHQTNIFVMQTSLWGCIKCFTPYVIRSVHRPTPPIFWN